MENKFCMFKSYCPENKSTYHCCYYCKNKCENECKDNPYNCKYNTNNNKLEEITEEKTFESKNSNDSINKTFTLHKISKTLNKDINDIRKMIKINNLNLVKIGGRYCLDFDEYIKLKSLYNM